jgi:NYN domain
MANDNIPVIIDGSNFVPRVIELGVNPRFISQQLSIRGLIDLLNERLPDVQFVKGQCETAEFVCSQKLLGSSKTKLTKPEQDVLLARLRSETGVYVDEINIPGGTEKGVDTTVAGRLDDLASSKGCCVLVTRDRDYIPVLHRLRHKLRVIIFDVLGDAPTDLRNEAFATLTLGHDYPSLFTYSYPTIHIARLDEESCGRLFAQADDRRFNQVRVKNNGDVYISCRHTGNKQLGGLRFRFETFTPFNDYVGPRAASDSDYVKRQLSDITTAWNGNHTGLLDYPLE